MSALHHVPNSRQQGSTLLVAIVLLLLASLMGLMAMNVGMFEQRSSGNDLRAKLVKETAEAGLSQGFEYLLRANPGIIDNAGNWELCGATDETFPCGAVPAAMRGNMFRLRANVGGYTDAGANPLATALTQYMLPTDSNKAIGGFNVAYGVAPVLCRVRLETPPNNTRIACADNPAGQWGNRAVVTFVSVAQVRGESGRTTLAQAVARSPILAFQGNPSTLIATGNVTPNGNGDVVAMPNAAGPGLDISVWTRQNVSMSSAFGTCDRQTFLESAGESLNDPGWRAKSLDGGCPKKGDEGWDILDNDGNAGTNQDVRAAEFPCDLFEYAFGVKAWKDTNGDGFCETRMPAVNVTLNGVNTSLYPDEAFLYANARQIIGGDPALTRSDQIKGALGAASYGLIWCRSGCDKGPPGKPDELGSPAKPVVFVVDGEMQTNGTIIYGLVFMRDPNATLDAATGGTASFKQNGSKAAVFGSVFIQGNFAVGSGNGPVVGDPEVLSALMNDPSLAQFDTLHGGWSDRYSY